jgi:hypothetical protein
MVRPRVAAATRGTAMEGAKGWTIREALQGVPRMQNDCYM